MAAWPRDLRLTALVVLAVSACVACGQQPPDNLLHGDERLVGGELDATDTGVVAVLRQATGVYHMECSGTLLTPNLLLTARHCLEPEISTDVDCAQTEFAELVNPSTRRVSVEANVGSDGIAPFQVAALWAPPGSNSVCGNDVGLMLLSGAGVPASLATPIEPALAVGLGVGDTFTAVGYGLQGPTATSHPTVGHRMSFADAEVICTGLACGVATVVEGEVGTTAPACPGDSGGPALDADGRVIGVAARGDSACTSSIYESVYPWRDFILDKTFEAATSGRLSPPAWAGDPPPGFEPLGLSCTGYCPSSYQCWAASGTTNGICVPGCSATDVTCPANFSCDTQLGVCTKPQDQASSNDSSCSLNAAGGSRSREALCLALAAALGAAWRRRRARLQRPPWRSKIRP